jgi:hypothetical protein
MQIAQQYMQPVQSPGAFGDLVVTVVGKQPQDDGVVLGLDHPQPLVSLSHRGDGHGIGDVGLAGAARPQQPGASGELGRDV